MVPSRTAAQSPRSLGPPCLAPPALRSKGRLNRAPGWLCNPGSDTRHTRSPGPDKRHTARGIRRTATKARLLPRCHAYFHSTRAEDTAPTRFRQNIYILRVCIIHMLMSSKYQYQSLGLKSLTRESVSFRSTESLVPQGTRRCGTSRSPGYQKMK